MKSDIMNSLTVWRPEGFEQFEKLDVSVEAIHDDYEGLRIILKINSPLQAVIKLEFEAVLSYRNTVESYLLVLWHQHEKSIYGRTFYIIENSEYLAFLHQMSMNVYEKWDIVHYAIYTNTDCIDVLATAPPKVIWLT